MNRISWKEIAEIIGVAAIVASLVFVGLQIRQSDTIARATLYQMRADSVLELSAMFLDNRDVTGKNLSLFQYKARTRTSL